MSESAQKKGTLFPPELVGEMMSKVKGHSSLALMCEATPVAFVGETEFTFNMDSEIDIVAESGEKSHGGVAIEPVTIVPIKFVYGARVSDEFMIASEKKQISILETFAEGFTKKLATGLDMAAFHGINPRTGTASAVIGNNCFDKAVTNTVSYVGTNVDENIESAIEMVAATENDVTGIVISPAARSAFSAKKGTDGRKLYPEFAFGGKPEHLGSQRLDVNRTVAKGVVDEGIVGDFANCFRWGYSEVIPLKIIEYGDPDNTGRDLAGHNEVYLRAEVYMGWAIFDPAAFCRIVD